MNAKTEQAILQSIAKADIYDEWRHLDNIMHDSKRSYYTVRKYLKDLQARGLIEYWEAPTNHLEEWWRLTDAGKAHMQEGNK